MQVTLKIFRYNPEVDKKVHYETYTLEADETERILDLLEMVKGHYDGTLSFRRSCAHGVCGSDAMRINGQNHLACKSLVRDVGDNDHRGAAARPAGAQGPHRGYGAVLRQLQEGAALVHQRQPSPENGRERIQSPEQRARFDDTTKCILCAACTTSCPSFWSSDDYWVPPPSSPPTASSSIAATRPLRERMEIVSETAGLARCHTIYNCTMACPRDIQITKAISELKDASITGKVE